MASTGITGSTNYDEAMPPRSIFDPPTMEEYEELSEDDAWCNTTNASSYADTLTTRDTLSSNFTGSLSRRIQHHKHPSQMNEVELRVQLWDAYRLARIILGVPIKSTSLRGKVILHSIRKVAEMKLELIRLQKELEMTKVYQDSQRSTASTIRMGPPKKRSSQSSSYDATNQSLGGSSSLCEELNIQIANIIVPEEHNDSSMLSTIRAASDDDDDDDFDEGADAYFDDASFPTPRRRGKQGYSVEQQVELYKARYEALQATHEEILMELQEQLFEMQAQIHYSTGNGQSDKDHVMVPPTTVSLGRSRSSSNNNTTSTTTRSEFAMTGRSLDSPDNAAGPSKPPRKGTKAISKAEDTLDAVAIVASEYALEDQTPEERHLRTVLAKPSHQVPARESPPVVDSSKPTTTTPLEHEKLQQMIQQLMQRVEASSNETKAQFEELQEQLQSYKTKGKQQAGNAASSSTLSPSMIVMQTQQQFQQRLQTAKTLHTLELETFKSKHDQQVQDLCGQLDAYRQQVQRQNVELQKWRRKYNHLESMVVTPEETVEVVRELQRLSTHPHATKEDHQRAHCEALFVLKRMAQLHVRQEKQIRLMQKTKALAKKREANTLEQLEDLKLQKELLEEDTQIPPEVWQRQLAQQRKAFEKEIKDIFKREERRMVEIERMEVDLTELAFMAVEIEDLEKEYKDRNEIFTTELIKARRQLATTAPLVETLHSQVRQLLVIQNKTLHDLDAAWAKGDESIKGPVLKRNANPQEVLLQEREEELQRVKAELVKSQHRIRELEKEIARG